MFSPVQIGILAQHLETSLRKHPPTDIAKLSEDEVKKIMESGIEDEEWEASFKDLVNEDDRLPSYDAIAEEGVVEFLIDYIDDYVKENP